MDPKRSRDDPFMKTDPYTGFTLNQSVFKDYVSIPRQSLLVSDSLRRCQGTGKTPKHIPIGSERSKREMGHPVIIITIMIYIIKNITLNI